MAPLGVGRHTDINLLLPDLDCAVNCRARQGNQSALRSLTEGKQTCRGHAKIDANDLQRTLGELFLGASRVGHRRDLHSRFNHFQEKCD